MTDINPYQPPNTEVRDFEPLRGHHDENLSVAPATLVGAGFGIRAAARILDTIAHYVVSLLSGLVAGLGVGIYSAATHSALEPLTKKLTAPAWYGFVLAIFGAALYHTMMESMYGATMGKRMLGLRVLASNGAMVRFRAAFGRSLAFYVDGLFFGIVAYESMKPPLQQRLGDKWCNTVVVKKLTLPDGWDDARPSFWKALVFGFLADGACCLVSLGIKLIS